MDAINAPIPDRSGKDPELTAPAQQQSKRLFGAEFTPQIEEAFGVSAVKPIAREFVLEYLRNSNALALATGFIELEKAARRAGYITDAQFFRSTSGEVPPIQVTFVNRDTAEYGLPNVELVYDSPAYRLNGESDSPREKKLATESSTAEGQNGGTGLPRLTFEPFDAPVSMVLELSSDPTGHRPFDAHVLYSEEAFAVDLGRATEKVEHHGEGDFSYLSDKLIADVLRDRMNSLYPEFGEKETAVIEHAERQGEVFFVDVKEPFDVGVDTVSIRVVVSKSRKGCPFATARAMSA